MFRSLLIAALLLFSFQVQAVDYNQVVDRSLVLLEGLVAAETTGGNESKAVDLIKKRFDSAGIKYEIHSFEKNRQNIVARLKGNGSKKPLLILAHSDVVPTAGQPWDTPPHKMVEKDGYLYGRGMIDDLGYVAFAVEILIEIAKDKTPLDRDLIVAITGDEEKGGGGIKYLLAHHRELLIDAEFALNEGGFVMLDDEGQPKYVGVSAAEKIYQDYKITASGTAGHSSLPNSDNAIYHLADALSKLGKHKEPVRILNVVAAFFKSQAELQKDPKIKAAMLAVAKNQKNPPKDAVAVLEKDASFNSIMRVTCVATVMQGGAINAKNVLPHSAQAYVNCRILPGQTPEEIQKKLARVFDNPRIKIEAEASMGMSDESVLTGPVMMAIEKVTKETLKVPITPALLTGATDSRFLRATGIPSYGLNPIFISSKDRLSVHGPNERMFKKTLPQGAEYFHRLVLELAASKK